jgi:hypothetical protein
VVRPDGDHELVHETRRAAHDVDVAEGDGIEASGIKAHAQMPNS